MSEIKRYNCEISYVPLVSEHVADMVSCEDGDWVRYADVAPLLAERDITPVDAEWLNRVMGAATEADEHWGKWKVGDVIVVRCFTSWTLGIGERYVWITRPTRGDVLTALRLFGGKR